MDVGLALAGGIATVLPELPLLCPRVGKDPDGGNVLGGSGGKSPCCALTRSDDVEIATMTPVGTSAGNVAATTGHEAA